MIYVVLAAGASSRMGFEKATAPLAGRSPLERIAAVLRTRPAIVVTRADLQDACARAMPGATILINPAPERGMTSSLRIADANVAVDETLGVLLADKPFLSEATLAPLEAQLAAHPSDVLYPVNDEGIGGHPVFFGPRARVELRGLPDGDTLARLRDAPSLRTAAIPCRDEGAFLDVDSPEAWREAERRLAGA